MRALKRKPKGASGLSNRASATSLTVGSTRTKILRIFAG